MRRWRARAGASDARLQSSTALEAGVWVTLRRERVTRLLGAAVPDDEVHAVLARDQRAGGERRPGDGGCSKPAHRFDIRIEADLIEEVARLRGFDKIAEIHATAPQIAGPPPKRACRTSDC